MKKRGRMRASKLSLSRGPVEARLRIGEKTGRDRWDEAARETDESVMFIYRIRIRSKRLADTRTRAPHIKYTEGRELHRTVETPSRAPIASEEPRQHTIPSSAIPPLLQ